MEIQIEVTGVNPTEFFGVNHHHLKLIQKYYPNLKISSRGNVLNVIGEENLVLMFEKKMDQIINYYHRYNLLNENVIEQLMLEENNHFHDEKTDDIIVHGNSGIKIKAKTINQRKLVKAVNENDMVFAVGPAGTGKTYTAVALAVRALKNKEVKRIILTRPAVEAGENLGFLPGDMKEKLDPYLMPLYDALRDMLPPEKLNDMWQNGIIEIAPLAFMRGRTLDKAFVILDEAQNTTVMQMKMFLTRMGQTAKFVITGDLTQIDLSEKHKSGLQHVLSILQNVNGISIVTLNQNDVIRHPLVKRIIAAFETEK